MQWTDILAPKETWKGFMLLSDIAAYMNIMSADQCKVHGW